MPLTDLRRRSSREIGFLIIPEFFCEEEITPVKRALERPWEERPSDITVDDVVTGEWLDRPPQPVPGEISLGSGAAHGAASGGPGARVADPRPPRPCLTLFERLRSLASRG